jgi:hypothetical protein
MVFCENKMLNLEFESASSEIASLQSVHDHMSAKLCGNCNMIMVNYVDLWLIHSHVAVFLRVPRWNPESSKLVPRCLVLAPLDLCLDLIWRLLSLRLKIFSIKLLILLAAMFYPLRVKRVAL